MDEPRSIAPSKARKCRKLLAALALCLASSIPHIASAQDCDGEYDMFSRTWVLSKVDCAADKLINAGTDLLKDLAKDLAMTALDQLVPGLSALFGGGKDSFAVQVEKILDAISESEENIITALVQSERDEQLQVDWPSVVERFNNMLTYRTDADRIGHFIGGYHQSLDEDLRSVRISLQNRENVFGIDALHTLVAVTSLHLRLIPEERFLAQVVGHGLSAGDLADLAPDLRQELYAAADFGARESIELLLAGESGVLPYFERLASDNKYRQYAEAAFSDLDRTAGAWTTAEGGPVYRYEVTGWVDEPDEERGGVKLVKRSIEHNVKAKIVAGTTRYGTCAMRCSYRYWLELPDGTVAERMLLDSPTPFDVNLARSLQREHREWKYRQSLAGAYAPVRSIIDGWYRQLGRSRPTFQPDRDLEAMFFPAASTCGNYPGDWMQRCSPLFEVEQLLEASTGAPALDAISATDIRDLTNYLTVHTWTALPAMRFSSVANDGLGGMAQPYDTYMRLVRAMVKPDAFDARFRGLFAAKFTAL